MLTKRRASSFSRSHSLSSSAFLALPYLDALGFIIRAADLRDTGDGGGLARQFIHARSRIHAADPRRRHSGPFLSSGPADTTHARLDPRSASRRHQRITPRGARRGSRRDRIRRPDGRGSRSAAIQDHAAGDRHHRRRGALDERSAAVPHRRQDRRLGISFSGGLSIVAAGRESIRDRVAFVMSFGGHGDLARALHYLTSGEVLGNLEEAKRSSAIARRRSCRRASPARLRSGRRPPRSRRSRRPGGAGRRRCRKASTASCWRHRWR